MKRWRKILFITALVVPFCMTLSPFAREKKETEELNPRDALWEISSRFVKGPFLLAKLWQSDSHVSNSHQTDVEEPVRLANGDDSAKGEPQKTVVEEKPKEMAVEPELKKAEPPSMEKKPEEVGEVKTGEERSKPVEEKPKLIEEKPRPASEKEMAVEEKPTVFPETRSAGFFSDVDYRGIGTIIESKEGKTLLVAGDIVYVAFRAPERILVGNKYTVFHASELVGHPITGKQIGRRYNIMGAIQIIDRYGQFYTGKIVEAFDGISKGDFVRPYNK